MSFTPLNYSKEDYDTIIKEAKIEALKIKAIEKHNNEVLELRKLHYIMLKRYTLLNDTYMINLITKNFFS